MQLLGYISRCYSDARHRERKPLVRIGALLSFIDEHYDEPITVKQLAQVAAMSETSLLRTFRRVVQDSPIDYVIRVRIAKAIEMMADPDVRITDVAFRCGFSDGNYFSRTFRKIMGESPREFRKRHGPHSVHSTR
jgi:AraC-like DNA-binding protein